MHHDLLQVLHHLDAIGKEKYASYYFRAREFCSTLQYDNITGVHRVTNQLMFNEVPPDLGKSAVIGQRIKVMRVHEPQDYVEAYGRLLKVPTDVAEDYHYRRNGTCKKGKNVTSLKTSYYQEELMHNMQQVLPQII